MVFTVSTRQYLGDHATIVTRDERGYEIPVMHIVPGDTDFPGDMDKLAANLASLLNGNEPLFDMDLGDNKLYWKRNENSIEFRIQEGDS